MESAIFEGYLEGEEREYAIECARFENQLDQLDTYYEMVQLQEEQMYKDAEFKVFSENGTYDDYDFYLEAAKKEQEEKTTNIFRRILDAILKLCRTIKDKLKSLFAKKDNDDDEVKIPENASKITKFLLGWKNEIKTGVKKLKNKDISGLKNLAKSLAIPAAILSLTSYGTYKVITRRKAKQEMEDLTEIVEDLEGNIIEVEHVVDNSGNNALFSIPGAKEITKKFLSRIREGISLSKTNSDVYVKSLGQGQTYLLPDGRMSGGNAELALAGRKDLAAYGKKQKAVVGKLKKRIDTAIPVTDKHKNGNKAKKIHSMKDNGVLYHIYSNGMVRKMDPSKGTNGVKYSPDSPELSNSIKGVISKFMKSNRIYESAGREFSFYDLNLDLIKEEYDDIIDIRVVGNGNVLEIIESTAEYEDFDMDLANELFGEDAEDLFSYESDYE